MIDDVAAAGDTLFDRVGGEDFFTGLVDAFYRYVGDVSELRALYPEELAGPRERLAAFLIQYFGGPRRYEALRGEPRLRLRHVEFPIDTAMRDRWVACMAAAIAESGVEGADAAALTDYFEKTATFLVNRGGLSIN